MKTEGDLGPSEATEVTPSFQLVSYQTNCTIGYEAKSAQEHDENSKSVRDFKITYAQDIKIT